MIDKSRHIMRVVVSRSWILNRLFVHLDLSDIRLDCRILLHSHVYMAIILSEEFVF